MAWVLISLCSFVRHEGEWRRLKAVPFRWPWTWVNQHLSPTHLPPRYNLNWLPTWPLEFSYNKLEFSLLLLLCVCLLILWLYLKHFLWCVSFKNLKRKRRSTQFKFWWEEGQKKKLSVSQHCQAKWILATSLLFLPQTLW